MSRSWTHKIKSFLQESVIPKAKTALSRQTQSTQELIERQSQRAKEHLEQTTRQGVQSLQDKTRSGVQHATSLLQNTTQKAAQKAAQTLTDATRAGAQQASNKMQEHSSTMLHTTIRTFWWWSLAAVAVYGLVTTLPAEYLRHLREKKRLQDATNHNRNDTSSQIRQEPAESWWQKALRMDRNTPSPPDVPSIPKAAEPPSRWWA